MESVTATKNLETIPSEKVPDISIILVCWNNKNYLDPCLKSLYEAGLTSTFDVFVVDNGSKDGSQEMLKEKYPDVKIIQNDHNVGLSKASNQGIEASTGRYVLLLNNDTIVNGQSLNAMADFLNEHPETGAVGGRLLNEDGSFQGGYAKFSNLFEEMFITTGLGIWVWPGYPSHYEASEPTQAGWMSSACLMVRREALNKTGLLDEQYFIYGDEADLQYRLHKAGWQIYYLPHANTLHFGGRSMNRWKRRKMVYRGKLLFYQKNYGWLQSWILRLIVGVLSSFKVLFWGIFSVVPPWRKRCILELKSNLEVIKLCVILK